MFIFLNACVQRALRVVTSVLRSPPPTVFTPDVMASLSRVLSARFSEIKVVYAIAQSVSAAYTPPLATVVSHEHVYV